MTHSPRQCLECGAEFAPRYPTQVCCTRECQRARTKRLDRREVNDPVVKQYRRERKTAARRREDFLAARDAAYIREYGNACGRPRGRLAHPIAALDSVPCRHDSVPAITRFESSKLAYKFPAASANSNQ